VPHDLLILGASARAAAMSAARCGINTCAGDYFADRDLAALCAVTRIDPQFADQQFLALADSLPRSPWLYTGGFENRRELVEIISRKHLLWGMPAHVLRGVRDPIAVADVLDRAGLPHPGVRTDPSALPHDGSWLVKPLASGGGRGISAFTGTRPVELSAYYYQERIDGPSYSAMFIGDGRAAGFLGASRQWLGTAGEPFVYSGGIGPWTLGDRLRTRVCEIGDRLAAAFGLIGWFGVDFILHNHEPWPVEVNPRYTASVEIHELASGISQLPIHRAFCEGPTKTSVKAIESMIQPTRIVAKRILYATGPLIAPDIRVDDNALNPPRASAMEALADIPWPGTRFEAGDPFFTILAADETVAACEERLGRLAAHWYDRLGCPANGPAPQGIESTPPR
jgi:predicted ATP-grasp superfamily ATP-dependent carboligase